MKKMSINIDQEKLEEICKKSEMKATDTIRYALKVYEILLDDINQGRDIIAKDKEGKEFYYKFIFP